MGVDDSGLARLGLGVHGKSGSEEGSVVVREPEPELLLDGVELRVGQTWIDRADGSETQATHGVPAKPPATVNELINPACHDAGLYLVAHHRTIHFRSAIG